MATEEQARKELEDRVYWDVVSRRPDSREFGAAEHVTGTLEELGKHYPPESFDLILCNGVFGWGLDDIENCDAAFAEAHRALRPGGQLLLGWNDVPRRAPFPLETVPSLAQFKKYDFPLFGTWRHLTDTVYRHSFDFYCK